MRATPIKRRCLAVSISAVLLIFSESATLAVKQAVQVVKPEFSQELGFLVKVNYGENGALEFKVVRNLSKARQFPADSELMTRRSATLKVSNTTGLLVSCNLNPIQDRQMLTYRFTLAKECVPLSDLTIAEVDDYKDENREHLIGGGAFYRIRLADFAEPAQLR